MSVPVAEQELVLNVNQKTHRSRPKKHGQNWAVSVMTRPSQASALPVSMVMSPLTRSWSSSFFFTAASQGDSSPVLPHN